MKDRLIDTFLRLVRTTSVTGRECAVADLIEQELTALGLTVTRDNAHESCLAECGNLFAFLPASAPGYPVLMLNAHIDTVVHEGDIEPVVEGDFIRSAGDTILGADDKAGVTLILLALRRIIEEKLPHGDLWIVFTVAEETGLWGALQMDYRKLQPWPELGYVLDGGRTPGVMGTAAPSSASFTATFTGCAAHAGVCPEQGISALQAAAHAIAAMQLGRLDPETTANIGIVAGGCARNIIPATCALKGEARSHDPAKLAAQVEHMSACLREAARLIGAEVEIDLKHDFTAFALAPDSPIVQRAAAAARRLGIEPQTEKGGGGSDANVFNEHALPSLMMATGAMDVHTPQEQLNIPASLQCLEWLVGTVVGN